MSQNSPMRFKIVTAVVLAASMLAGCSSSDSRSSKSKSSTSKTNKKTTATKKAKRSVTDELRTAVETYSNAFLTGDATTAYGLLSERCRERLSQAEFTETVNAAKQTYGTALRFESYSGTTTGDRGTATYTYSAKALDQKDEPWTREGGNWHRDNC